MQVGILHPGAMGTSVGGALVGAGHDVVWASQGRSDATRSRADADGLVERATTATLVAECEVLLSVCPPGAAVAVATEIAELGFGGLYLDANAVAPATARTIATTVTTSGATFVDGGIIGPPARHRGLTVLYVAGSPAGCATVGDLFAESVLLTHTIAGGAGAASAVKMAFAAWTKGTSALLLAIGALAEAEGVAEGLGHAWSMLTPELADRLPATARSTAPKAWRFVAEMEEIAATFADAGLPSGFHTAAAQVYGQLAELRHVDGAGLDDVIARLGSGKPADNPADKPADSPADNV